MPTLWRQIEKMIEEIKYHVKKWNMMIRRNKSVFRICIKNGTESFDTG